jgi:hypothetical protein
VFTFDEAFVKPFEPRTVSPLRKTAHAKSKKRGPSAKQKKAGLL